MLSWLHRFLLCGDYWCPAEEVEPSACCSGALSCPADGPSVRYGTALLGNLAQGCAFNARVVHLMRQKSAGVLLGQMRWKSPIAGGGEAEGGVGTREVQVRAGPTSSAGESTRAKVRGGCTRALAPMGAPRCPGRCHPTTLVFGFSYPCQVLVRCLTFPQKTQLKGRRVTRMLQRVQADGCSLAPGPSRDQPGERGQAGWAVTQRDANLPGSLLPTALELCPAPGVLPLAFI